MVREELIEGAITFLQDASVASAPVEQKIAFLRSKNLTQEEIDASLARVGQPQQPQSYPPSQPPQQPQQAYRQPQQYANYPQNAYNQQQQPPYWPPPPDPPRRDWRDYFITATLLSGVGYALFWTTNRYILPLISPPTPAQLTQDKESIDTSFTKAFALLDQLASDTQTLKDSETARTERLDAALAEVESVVGRMKEANEERVREGKGLAREISEVKDMIPRVLEKERKGTEDKLGELAGEMRSLRTLVGSRMQGPAAVGTQAAPTYQPRTAYGAQSPANGVPASSTSAPAPTAATPETNGTPTNGTAPTDTPASALPPPSSTSASSYGRKLGAKPQIPQWQLAAKKKTEDAAAAKKDDGVPATTDTGTSTPATLEGMGGKVAEVSEEVGAEA